MDICPLLVGGGESERVMGYSGGGVLIKCRYETQYTSNPKYLCKGSWPGLTCTDQFKTGVKNKWINSGRFSLFDDTSAAQFWVMIREFTVEDSGTYNCAVDKDLAIDVYTPVELKVEEGESLTTLHLFIILHLQHHQHQLHIKSRNHVPYSPVNKHILILTVLLQTLKESRRWINDGKLYLHDDGKQTFTVIINSLTEGDSGEYWCGAESDWTSDHGYKAYITQINLRVTGESILC
uniref:Ig-like domain-containing protein n=1 Tax=Pygocentrus nattereri TaxID=42514 RepID=A0AAR2M4B5_PYGNA